MRSIWQVIFAVGLLAPRLTDAAAVDRAEAPVPIDASAMEATQQALKLQALQLSAEARLLADERSTPRSERLSIYIGQSRKDTRVHSLSVSIDDGEPITVDFPADAATALATGGTLRRIATIGLAPGPHQLRATMLALDQKPDAAEQPLRAELEARFEKAPVEHGVVIRLQEPGLMAASALSLERWLPGASRRGWIERALKGWSSDGADRPFSPYTADDPALSHARHLLAMHDAAAAIIELEALRLGLGGHAALPVDYWIELARAYRGAGLLDQAAATCDLLDAGKTDRSQVALERLRLAEDAYDRGNLPQAESLLMKARAHLPAPSAADWRLTYASLLLAQDKAADAAAVLKQADPASVEAFRFMSEGLEALRAAAYRRYNLAVALVQHGEERLGLSWLDLVGRLKSSDSQMLALRDQANLTLGWHFLKSKQGGTAVGILGRIRSEGPFSNAALVGIGWAQLEPAGSKSWRQQLGDASIANPDISAALPSAMRSSLMQLGVLEPELFGARGPRPFATERPPEDLQQGLRRAIALWSLLKDRNPADPSVQEAMLAIAYAHDQLEDFAGSRKAYAEAIAMLESVHANIRTRTTSLRNGDLSERLLNAVGPGAYFEVMADYGLDADASSRTLYTTVARYRDVSATLSLLRALDLPAELSERVNALASLLDVQQRLDADLIQQLALSQIEHRQQTLQEYLKAAYFSAARIEDLRLASESGAATTSDANP